MPSYQTVLILKPDSEEERVNKIVEKVNHYISKNGGDILKTEKWGKKRLAYRVKKNRFGFYINIYHTCDSSKIRGLEDGFRLNETIIKYLILRLDQKYVDQVLKEKFAAEAAEAEKKEAAEAEKKETAEVEKKETAEVEKKNAVEDNDTAKKQGLTDEVKQPAAEG